MIDSLARKRLFQLVQFGWPQSKVIAKDTGKSRVLIFFDMLLAYRKYHLWSNQYVKERWFLLEDDAQRELGKQYKNSNDRHDVWVRDKFENRKFLNKYTSRKWDLSEKKDKKRYEAYQNRYNIQEGGIVANNVVLERNHFLNGTIDIGKNVLL